MLKSAKFILTYMLTSGNVLAKFPFDLSSKFCQESQNRFCQWFSYTVASTNENQFPISFIIDRVILIKFDSGKLNQNFTNLLFFLENKNENMQVFSCSQPGGTNHPPQIWQKVHFWPQSGTNMGFLWEGWGGEVQKVHFLGPKGPLLGGSAPPQIRSWLRACVHTLFY